MLQELPITLNLTISTQFENTPNCHICESEMKKQNHCDFCGKSTCESCIVKRRKHEDEVWHPICEDCELQFIEYRFLNDCKNEREQITKELEQANNDLVSKRSQLYQMKNFSLHHQSAQHSEQKLQQLDDDIKGAQIQLQIQQQQIQAGEVQKIELKSQNADLTQNLEIKTVKLQEIQSKVQKEKVELDEIQRQIDEFMANLPLLEAEQKSALTQLDISNLEQIFRGSNLSEMNYQVKQSQAQLQSLKGNKNGQQNKQCIIF